jgi:hypothetical protein
MTNAIKVLLQMQSSFLQLESTLDSCFGSLLTNSPTNIKNPSKSSAHEQTDFFDVPTSGG